MKERKSLAEKIGLGQRKPEQYEFDPTEDITAQELALVLKEMQLFCQRDLYENGMSENVQRHFKPKN